MVSMMTIIPLFHLLLFFGQFSCVTRGFSLSMKVATNNPSNRNTNTKHRRSKPKRRTNHNRNYPSNVNHNNKNNKPPSKSKTAPSAKDLASMSIGTAIQSTWIPNHLLGVMSRLWIPTDENLPSHLVTQAVHHEARIRWSSQALEKLGDCFDNQNHNEYREETEGVTEEEDAVTKTMATMEVWNDQRLARAILACSLPFIPSRDGVPGMSGVEVRRSVHRSLMGLHALAGKTLSSCSISQTPQWMVRDDVLEGMATLIIQAEGLAGTQAEWTLRDVTEVRWAIRGLIVRIPFLLDRVIFLLQNKDQNENDPTNNIPSSIELQSSTRMKLQIIAKLLPNLERRVSSLPFDIVPQALDWSSLLLDNTNATTSICSTSPSTKAYQTLLHELPFQFDTITTRTGTAVPERRGTTWIASRKDVGALAYSGKLMAPHFLSQSSFVVRAMRLLEQSLFDNPFSDDDGNDDIHDEKHLERQHAKEQWEYHHSNSKEYFDCALCNHYPDPDAACRFHTDPEHGTVWERFTCVVSAGSERKFAFRPIPNCRYDWNHWDTNWRIKQLNPNKHSNTKKNGNQEPMDIDPAVIHLFSGDTVKMWGECNDLFHHAVYVGQDCTTTNGNDAVVVGGEGRVSLVFKKAMDRGNGKKGHGHMGHGRRARRKL